MKKIFSLFAAILFAGSMMAEVKTYTLTITTENFTKVTESGSGYAPYNGDHTFTATATDASGKTMDVVIFSNQVMPSSDSIQAQKTNGYLYNKTNLGTISSIVIDEIAGKADKYKYTQIIGDEENPSSAAANGAYFKIAAGTSGAAKAKSIVITFTKDDAVPVQSVALDITSKTIEVGESFTLTPSITPADAANTAVTWSTSSTNATVENGVVTGLAAGSATITCTTVDGNKTATCEVTVTEAVPSDYVETAFASIKTQDEVVITMTIDSVAKTFALNGGNATGSAPKADLVRFVGTSIKPITEDHVFLVSKVDGGYQFALKSDNTKVLYAFANSADDQNNDIRVASVSGTASGVWSFDADNHLYATPASDARYLCVYSSSDWRSYKSTSGGYANVEAQTLKFYVKSIGGSPVVPTAIENAEVAGQVQKVIENGQLFIIKNGVKYNAQGAAVR